MAESHHMTCGLKEYGNDQNTGHVASSTGFAPDGMRIWK